MTEYFFDDQEKIKLLRQSLVARRGQRFNEVNNNCALFVRGVVEDCGYPKDLLPSVGQVSLNYAKHHSQTPLLAWTREVLSEGLVMRVDEDEDVRAGDLVIISEHANLYHVTIAEDSWTLWHLPRKGVVQSVRLIGKSTSAKIKLKLRILDTK